MHDEAAVLTAAEFHFREGIWGAAPGDAVEELMIRKRRFGPVLATVCAGLPAAGLMNVVEGAAEPEALRGGHLAAAVEWTASHEVDYLVKVARGRPESAAAEEWLAGCGYEQSLSMRSFMRAAPRPGEVREPAIEVRELSALQTERMSMIVAQALGLPALATVAIMNLPDLPGWRCYAACLEGREVACGAMHVDDEEGVAILGLDATEPAWRRRGCQRALIARRLADAAGAGCHTVLAAACDFPAEGAAAGRGLLRAGFVEAGRSVNWRLPPRACQELRLHTPEGGWE